MAFRITEAGLAGTLGAVLNPIAAWLLFSHLPEPTFVTLVAAGIAAALVLGMIEGLLIRRPNLSVVIVGTLLGGLLMWIPMVVMTYGFALMGIPLLAAFAVFVWFGARIGSFFRAQVGSDSAE